MSCLPLMIVIPWISVPLANEGSWGGGFLIAWLLILLAVFVGLLLLILCVVYLLQPKVRQEFKRRAPPEVQLCPSGAKAPKTTPSWRRSVQALLRTKAFWVWSTYVLALGVYVHGIGEEGWWRGHSSRYWSRQLSRDMNGETAATMAADPQSLPVAIEILCRSSGRNDLYVPRSSRIAASNARSALNAMGPQAYPALFKMLQDDDPIARRNATATLYALDLRDKPLSPELVATIKPLAEGPPGPVRHYADQVLLFGKRECQTRLRHGQTPEERVQAARSLQAWGTSAQEAAVTLVAVSRDDPNQEVRAAAIEALRSVCPDLAHGATMPSRVQ